MDYLPKLTERIAYTMKKYELNSICDRALLLDCKAELFVIRKDYGNAFKKRLKALEIRLEYGIFEPNDTLQLLMNLTSMLILSKDYELANQALSFYESLVLEHEG